MKWWLVLLIGCGGCAHQHTKPDEDLYAPSKSGGDRGPTATHAPQHVAPAAWPAPLERWAALTHELGESLRGTKTCGEVGRTLRAFTSKNSAELGSLQHQLIDWELTAPSKEIARYYRGIGPDLNLRIDAGIRCKDDTTARAAFDQFFKVAGLDLR